ILRRAGQEGKEYGEGIDSRSTRKNSAPQKSRSREAIAPADPVAEEARTGGAADRRNRRRGGPPTADTPAAAKKYKDPAGRRHRNADSAQEGAHVAGPCQQASGFGLQDQQHQLSEHPLPVPLS